MNPPSSAETTDSNALLFSAKVIGYSCEVLISS
jgi:hypothetical protein